MVVIPIPSPRNKIALLAVLVFGFNFTLSWTSFTPALYHSLLSWFRKTSPWTPGKLSWYLSHCLVFLARARARDRRLKGKGNKKGNLRVGVHKGHAKENVTKRRPQTPEKRRLYMADFLSIHSDSQANRVKVTEALFYFTGYNFLPTWKAIRYRMIGTGTGMKLVVMVPERGWRRWFVALNPSLLLNIYLRFSGVPVLAPTSTCSRCYEEWHKPTRYVTIHFENRRGEASLRNINCTEITIVNSSPISYCFLVGTWAFRYFVIIALEFRPMPCVSRISDNLQTLAFSRALISLSFLLQTPLNFIQANSLTLRESSFFSMVSEASAKTTGLRLWGHPLTKRPHWKGKPPSRKRNGLSTPRKNAANG